MGLDMYLNARKFTSKDYFRPELYNKLVQEAPFALDTATLEVNVAYWRKSNQIHAWFVKHVQGGKDDCGEYSVSRDQLQLLVDNCKLVLIQKEEAPNLLPVQEGFFFGSYEYDEWYFDWLKEAREILVKMLEEDWEYYYSCWW